MTLSVTLLTEREQLTQRWQQALAKHGLNYVIDTYLPEKLKHPERFLP